ncbi:sensor histidine kinase [Mycolicibacterium grossiae]|uniref:histidine kinase n=1 Tax=Mycolicibacterium grossiae TaxID=1552759 RepID=A0A1E8Q6G9_9MYCO|nr:sensor histidine kinase [Mycolicibacterium grossiae]OFJ54067.1 histidine kinase [Mycolicibacterium grossiae]
MPDRPSPGRRLTVQGWQNLVLLAMGVVVLAGAVTGAVLVDRTDDVSRSLIDDIQPARVASYRLQAALRDQETATRGYAITADRQFLQPYYDGRQAEDAAREAMVARLGDRPDLLADLDAVEGAANQWRTAYAEPLIASIAPGAARPVAPAVIEQGKTEFDEIRRLFDVQSQHLQAARDDGVAELDAVRSWRDRVLVAMLTAFFLAAVALAILIRNAVTGPLEKLAQACRRITDGHFDERITPRGPKDIRGIASDVEDMRQRIVAELEASQEARAQLDEQALDLRRSNAELEQFAYVASHDLQEPLRKVTSFCQLIEKRYGDKLDERGVEYIGFAVDGAKRMQVLINDLLTFSRVGRLHATHDEVSLDAALDVALGNLGTAIDEADAQIDRPAGGLPTVLGDPTLMSMLWQNLIGNAVKFRREGIPPHVVVEVDRGEEAWNFSVTDNGIGIGEEFAEKVFVIFQRLHGRDVYSGTGIGLALCKKIVEYHGGTIWIDTAYTDGTRFRFTLPVMAAGTDDALETTGAPDTSGTAGAEPALEGTHE